MMPVAPGCKADGMNTADSTTVMATIAPVICPIALRVASLGSLCSSLMMRSTFSMTTIASSTTMPMASTIPNSVSWLSVKCSSDSPMNVPSSATGMTSVGMIVARMFCRKISITRNTRTMASTRVCTTSVIDAVMNGVVSYGTLQVTPAGRSRSSVAIAALTAVATDSALAPGNRKIARPPAGLPS